MIHSHCNTHTHARARGFSKNRDTDWRLKSDPDTHPSSFVLTSCSRNSYLNPILLIFCSNKNQWWGFSSGHNSREWVNELNNWVTMNSIVDLCHTKCKHTPSRSHEARVVQQHLSIKLPGITTACPGVGRNDRLAFLHGIKWCKLNCGHGAFFCANAWASHHQPGFNLMPLLDVMARLRCLSARVRVEGVIGKSDLAIFHVTVCLQDPGAAFPWFILQELGGWGVGCCGWF